MIEWRVRCPWCGEGKVIHGVRRGLLRHRRGAITIDSRSALEITVSVTVSIIAKTVTELTEFLLPSIHCLAMA